MFCVVNDKKNNVLFEVFFILGTLPKYDDGNVSREACVQTENNICEESIDIEIRNCGGYYIYFLQETPPNSSFCFGMKKK